MTLGPIDDPSEFEPVAGIAGILAEQLLQISSMCVSRSRTEDMWIDEDDVEYTLNPSGEGGDVTTQDHMPR